MDAAILSYPIQPIAIPVDCSEAPTILRRQAKTTPHSMNVRIQSSRRQRRPDPPHSALELTAQQESPCVLQKEQPKIEVFGCQLNRLAVAPCLTTNAIDLQAGEVDETVTRLRPP
jgi:hypothetical protein